MNEGQQGWAKEQWRANKRADFCTMTWQQETRDRLRDKSCMVYRLFYQLVMVLWRGHREIMLPVTTSLSKKAKRKHVALSKVKIDCRCRKLSPFFCQLLSAVGESGKDCRHIFERCRLSPKPLGRPHWYRQPLCKEMTPQSFVVWFPFSNDIACVFCFAFCRFYPLVLSV